MFFSFNIFLTKGTNIIIKINSKSQKFITWTDIIHFLKGISLISANDICLFLILTMSVFENVGNHIFLSVCH